MFRTGGSDYAATASCAVTARSCVPPCDAPERSTRIQNTWSSSHRQMFDGGAASTGAQRYVTPPTSSEVLRASFSEPVGRPWLKPSANAVHAPSVESTDASFTHTSATVGNGSFPYSPLSPWMPSPSTCWWNWSSTMSISGPLAWGRPPNRSGSSTSGLRLRNSVTPATRSAVATITAITEPAFQPEVSIAGGGWVPARTLLSPVGLAAPRGRPWREPLGCPPRVEGRPRCLPSSSTTG